MNEHLDLLTEQVDDIALLIAQLERMEVASVLDDHFQTHGNWQELSLGKTAVVWLTHILSAADHRLNQVEDWSGSRLHTLHHCVGERVEARHFTDDRLAALLRYLSVDADWDRFESQLNSTLLRVYDLSAEVVRLDSTTMSGYYSVSEDGLFQFGHSKDRRPDLPQLKVMLSSLDPLGLPLGIEVLSGEQADDRLYIPAIKRVRASIAGGGLLYIGDTKMASLENRSFVAHSDDFYLCPLPKSQLSEAELNAYLLPVWEGEQALEAVFRENNSGELEKIAEGYEVIKEIESEVDGKPLSFQERHLVLRSEKLAEYGQEKLDDQLERVCKKLLAFNERKRGKKRHSLQELQKKVNHILKGSQVASLLEVEYQDNTQKRVVKGYQGKAERIEEDIDVMISVQVNQTRYEQTVRALGWRVYATNTPKARLPLAKATLAYRDEYIIEGSFKRLKNRPLSIRPMHLQTDHHIIGLIRLLSIALKVLVLIEQQVRKQLSQQQQSLSSLYAGNPKRSTQTPTSTQLLGAFKQIYLTIIFQQQQTIYHITELNELQLRILELLGFSNTIYTGIAQHLKPG